jgi:NAD(P)-dependent dehydrogenase (short-subunit alcohol dehydrogenase family)
MPPTLRCDPKQFDKDLTDQIFIVTGANSGCGLETTRQLVKQGGTVILACRNAERGQVAAKETNGIFLTTLDLASLQSIRDFVDAFKEKYDRLDGLVNNAGKGIKSTNKIRIDYFLLFGLP